MRFGGGGGDEVQDPGGDLRTEHTCILLVWSRTVPNYPLAILFTAQIMIHYSCKAPHSGLTTFDSSKARTASLANKQTYCN